MSVECVEILINEVRKHPELYDSSSRGFRDVSLKARIYENIAKKLGGDWNGPLCKQKWKNLRDTYLKHLRGSFKPQSRPWTWTKEMSFLEPHMQTLKRPQMRRKTIVVEEENDSEYEIEEEFLELEDADDTKMSASTNKEYYTQESIARTDPLHEESVLVHSNNTSSPLQNFDDTDLIFLGYAKTVKRLKMTRQIQTKFQIAQLIMNAELEELADKDSTDKSFKRDKNNYLSDG